MATFFNQRNVVMGLMVLAILFPFITQNNYYIYVITLAFIWIIAVYGLNLIAGYTGYLSFAHAGFFAIGAYAMGLLSVKAGIGFWPAFLLAPMITTAIGFLLGIIALRTKEHFFAIYTLCVGYIIYLVIDKWDRLTEGPRGLMGIPSPANIGPISFSTPVSQYYFVLFFLLLTIFVMFRIINSLTGRTFLAVRNSEILAQTIGVSTIRTKLVSFVLSTFFAGLAGALYACFLRFLGPQISSTAIMFDLLAYLIVGGIGTLSGPIIGTLLIVFITQKLQFLQEYRMLLFGPILTLIIIFSPRGIAGFFGNWKSIRKEKRMILQKNKKAA
ncbi:branched-chain amino acid ABC transporter permease [Cytobacillus depressus]|uniref:Branched-chain amino acid ABC transporter permease n=1 Tax=Cytobacillus depressus TaxID=1602942 RepID=A0A6L3VAE5_9BACI|nr:branched-chain amino acid ABC transporter permease [Cytobacillus depressus]KAB2338580.1 branched-chain amino acid ABC transporter permease [Cytobacillus depressus]